MMLTNQELAVGTAGVALVAAGTAWLWGPIPLVVIGALILTGFVLFADF